MSRNKKSKEPRDIRDYVLVDSPTVRALHASTALSWVIEMLLNEYHHSLETSEAHIVDPMYDENFDDFLALLVQKRAAIDKELDELEKLEKLAKRQQAGTPAR